jgi:hypothetical protein
LVVLVTSLGENFLQIIFSSCYHGNWMISAGSCIQLDAKINVVKRLNNRRTDGRERESMNHLVIQSFSQALALLPSKCACIYDGMLR